MWLRSSVNNRKCELNIINSFSASSLQPMTICFFPFRVSISFRSALFCWHCVQLFCSSHGLSANGPNVKISWMANQKSETEHIHLTNKNTRRPTTPMKSTLIESSFTIRFCFRCLSSVRSNRKIHLSKFKIPDPTEPDQTSVWKKQIVHFHSFSLSIQFVCVASFCTRFTFSVFTFAVSFVKWFIGDAVVVVATVAIAKIHSNLFRSYFICGSAVRRLVSSPSRPHSLRWQTKMANEFDKMPTTTLSTSTSLLLVNFNLDNEQNVKSQQKQNPEHVKFIWKWNVVRTHKYIHRKSQMPSNFIFRVQKRAKRAMLTARRRLFLVDSWEMLKISFACKL